jgi:hypothetical protein
MAWGAPVEIGSWLHSLGLERYEAAFRANAIDTEVLPEVTEADLEKLPVLLGHRKRTLRAIAELQPAPLPIPDQRSLSPSERACDPARVDA